MWMWPKKKASSPPLPVPSSLLLVVLVVDPSAYILPALQSCTSCAGLLFDHEKLDVYQLEPAVISWLTDLFEELRNLKGARLAETLDQLDRASISGFSTRPKAMANELTRFGSIL